MNRKKTKVVTGRSPLFFSCVKNSKGIWWDPIKENHEVVPTEDVGKFTTMHPLEHILSTCYFCGRRTNSTTFAIRKDEGDKWELINNLNMSEEEFDACEAIGLYKEGTLTSPCETTLLTKGYGICFREKIWVFQLCPECQVLLALPELHADFEKEADMKSTLYMTGRSVKTEHDKGHVRCYFCGRQQGSESVNLKPMSNGEYEMSLVTLYLTEVVRAASPEHSFKYFLCPECEILLGRSPRIAITNEGQIEDGSFFEVFEKYTDIKNASKDPQFVKKAAALCNSIGAEEFISQLVSKLNK